MARESEYTPLLKLTSRALENDRHELANRVKVDKVCPMGMRALLVFRLGC
jgi:hypothetical protein